MCTTNQSTNCPPSLDFSQIVCHTESMIKEPTDAMLDWIEQHEIESYDAHLESQFEDWVMCVTEDELHTTA